MHTHTCTGTGTGTVHRVRGLCVRSFSMTLQCRQPHSVFGGIHILNFMPLLTSVFHIWLCIVSLLELLRTSTHAKCALLPINLCASAQGGEKTQKI